MDGLQCTGSENSLDECYFNGWESHDCSHSEDVSVVCAVETTTVSQGINVFFDQWTCPSL